SSELVSFAPFFVGYPWCMRIIKPWIGSRYPDRVIRAGANFKFVIVGLNDPLRSSDIKKRTRQIRKRYWRVSFRSIRLEPDEMIDRLGGAMCRQLELVIRR